MEIRRIRSTCSKTHVSRAQLLSELRDGHVGRRAAVLPEGPRGLLQAVGEGVHRHLLQAHQAQSVLAQPRRQRHLRHSGAGHQPRVGQRAGVQPQAGADGCLAAVQEIPVGAVEGDGDTLGLVVLGVVGVGVGVVLLLML